MSDNGPSEFQNRPELVRKRAHSIIVVRVFQATIALAVAVMLSIQTYNAITLLDTRGRLLDCTTPEGECYKDGERRTQRAVQHLIESNSLDEVATRRIVILAAACASNGLNNTYVEVQRCVDRQLKEQGR